MSPDVSPKSADAKWCHLQFLARWIYNKFFTCDSGSIGVARSVIQKNDKIYVVKGSRDPFILRPCEVPPEHLPAAAPGEKYYALVGVCYLHKFMNGEAVEGDVNWESLLLY